MLLIPVRQSRRFDCMNRWLISGSGRPALNGQIALSTCRAIKLNQRLLPSSVGPALAATLRSWPLGRRSAAYGVP